MNREQSVAYAKKYLEDMISFFGLNMDVVASESDDVIQLSIPSSDINSILIGHNGETLRSIQYLVSTTLRNKNSLFSRVNVDVADYKKIRADKLADKARGWIDQVRETGDSKILDLNAADRRVVHQVATEYSDIKTFSEGEGRERRLIIAQASS